jgi:hypothetical protein
MQLAGLILNEYHDAEIKPSAINVDVIGIGSGVVDRLREHGLPVVAVNVAENPAIKHRFVRLRDELWWKVREWFEERDCKLPDPDDSIGSQSMKTLIDELIAVKYKPPDSDGRIKMESKTETKKRLTRIGSPDLADSFMLTFFEIGHNKANLFKPLTYPRIGVS